MWKSGNPAFLERSGPGFFLAAMLLLASVYGRFADLPQQMDLRLYDESYYLCQGVFQPVNSWLADYSALYSLWYRFLHLLTGAEATDLYFLNYGIWTLILGLVVYHFSRLAGLSFPLALSWALLATAAQVGLPLWPKAGHFTMMGTAVLFWFFLQWRHQLLKRMLLLAGGLFLLSWARPEFFAGGILALFFTGFYFWKNKESLDKQSFIFFLTGIFLVAGCVMIWGWPIGRSGRGMVAFGQHFVHNLRILEGASADGLNEDWVNWREISLRILGTDRSVSEAISNQPLLVLRHIGWNAGQLIWVPFQYFFETLIPQRLFPFSVPVGVALLFVGFDALSGFRSLGQGFSKALVWIRSQGFDLLPLLLPSMLAGLIFQARTHYLLPLFPVFVYGVARLLVGFSLDSLPSGWKKMLPWVLPLVLYFILPPTSSYFKAGKSPFPGNRPFEHFGCLYSGDFSHRKLVDALQKADFPEGSRWFDASTGATEFLGTRIQRFGKIGFELDYPQITDMEAFLYRNDIQFVLLHPTMDYDHVLRRNGYLNQLRRDPSSLNWEKRKLIGTGDSVLVRLQK